MWLTSLETLASTSLATPFVFSTVWQGSEDRTLDPKRTSIETTIGATAGAVISVGFAGMSAAASRALNVPKIKTDDALSTVLKNNSIDPDNLILPNDTGSYKVVIKLLEELKKEVNTTFNTEPIPRKFTEGTHPNDFPMFLELRKNNRILITPIPGKSTHGETAWLSPLTDWSIYG